MNDFDTYMGQSFEISSDPELMGEQATLNKVKVNVLIDKATEERMVNPRGGGMIKQKSVMVTMSKAAWERCHGAQGQTIKLGIGHFKIKNSPDTSGSTVELELGPTTPQ